MKLPKELKEKEKEKKKIKVVKKKADRVFTDSHDEQDEKFRELMKKTFLLFLDSKGISVEHALKLEYIPALTLWNEFMEELKRNKGKGHIYSDLYEICMIYQLKNKLYKDLTELEYTEHPAYPDEELHKTLLKTLSENN